jgi:predicted MFS family arabinose efflux permease
MIQRAFRLYRDAFSGLGRDVWLVSLVLLVNRAGTMVLPFISLYLTEDRGLSVAVAGRVLALYGLGAIAGGYLGGWLCDHVGSQRAQQLSLTASGVMFLWFVWLEGVAAISIAVFFLSVVAESYRPAAMAAIGERAPREVQGRAFALLRLAANIGMGIGPAIGGWLATYDYRSLFIVDAVSCWLATIPLFLLPAVATTSGPADHASGAPVARSPWRDRPFLLLMLLVVAMAAVIFQIFSTLPLYFRRVYGLPPSSIGLLLALNAGLIVIFEMVLIYWVERFSRMRMVALGGFVLCCGFGLMPLGSSIPFAAFTIAVWTFGEMLSLPLLNVAVAARAPAAQRGRYMGVYTMAFAIAFVFAPAAGTYVFERFGPDVLWYAIGAIGPLIWIGARSLGRYFDEPGASS